MDTMLEQCRNLDRIVNTKCEQLAAFRSLAVRTCAPRMGEPLPRCNSHSDNVGDIVEKIVDTETEINEYINRLYELRREVIKIIDAIPDPVSQQLLTLRYVSGKTWEYTAERMEYDCGYVIHNLHPKALALFKKYKIINKIQ